MESSYQNGNQMVKTNNSRTDFRHLRGTAVGYEDELSSLIDDPTVLFLCEVFLHYRAGGGAGCLGVPWKVK